MSLFNYYGIISRSGYSLPALPFGTPGSIDIITTTANVNNWELRSVSTISENSLVDYINITGSMNSFNFLQNSVDNKFINVYDVDNTTITFKTVWKIINPIPNNFQIIGVSGFNFIGESISYDSTTKVYTLKFKDFDNINMIQDDITLVCSGVVNEAGTEFNTFENTFTSVNLEPNPPPIPRIEVIWNV